LKAHQLPILTNFRIGMASFVDPHKVVVRIVFLAFPSVWNEVVSKGGTESGSEFGFTKDP